LDGGLRERLRLEGVRLSLCGGVRGFGGGGGVFGRRIGDNLAARLGDLLLDRFDCFRTGLNLKCDDLLLLLLLVIIIIITHLEDAFDELNACRGLDSLSRLLESFLLSNALLRLLSRGLVREVFLRSVSLLQFRRSSFGHFRSRLWDRDFRLSRLSFSDTFLSLSNTGIFTAAAAAAG